MVIKGSTRGPWNGGTVLYFDNDGGFVIVYG